jgi:hypothetical protein
MAACSSDLSGAGRARFIEGGEESRSGRRALTISGRD